MNKLTESQLTLKKKFTVTSADTDMFGNIKLSKLIDFLIQSAISSADKLGFGLKFLKEEQLFWVLSRISVKIEKQLKWYDVVEVETWPKNVEGLLYIRDFIVRDKKQNIVARGTSGWLAVDVKTVRPKIINGIITEAFYALKEKYALKESPDKLSYMENGELREIQTTFFDIDLNHHVTTTRYIDWMMDCFSVEFLSTHTPKSISVNFLKEIKPNEKIQLFKNTIAENSFRFEGFNLQSKKQAYRSQISFRSIK